MKYSSILCGLTGVVLAGCGGTTADTAAVISKIEKTSGPATIVLGTDPTSGNPTLSSGTFTTTLSLNSNLKKGTFTAFNRGSTQRLTSQGSASSAEVRTGTAGAIQTLYAIDEIAITAQPNGAATLNGTYVGFFPLTGASGDFIHRGSTGDVALTLTFKDGVTSLGGNITNRTTTSVTTGVPDKQYGVFEDLTLLPATISSDGSFTGSTSDGYLNKGIVGQERVAVGTFEGLVTGPDAAEAVGAISMEYAFPTQTVREYGVFAAGH